jgi:hypothetical protein
MRHAWIMVLVVLSGAPAVAQVAPVPTVITPPRPMATIEFVAEAGVERWEVTLTGDKLPAPGRRARRWIRCIGA